MSSASQLDVPIKTLLQTVKALQLKQSRLELQQRELEQENAELKAEKRVASKRKDKSKSSKKAQRHAAAAATTITAAATTIAAAATAIAGGGACAPNGPAARDLDSGDEDEDEDGPDALQLGKMYFVCGELWIVPGLPDLFRIPKPGFAYNDPSHYDKTTPEAILIGAAADLYRIVPKSLHAKISSPAEFQREFTHGFGDGRSNFVSTVRSLMPLIFGLNVDYFLKGNVLMRKSPEVAGFLKYNLEEETYPSLPPFLFPNRTFDITQAFRMDHLVKALSAILRGKAWAMGHRGGTPKTNCELWHVNTIDECMIAMTTTIVAHLLSPTEGTFQKHNGVLDLYGFFQTCKQLLIGGSDSPYFKDLLWWYQERIFGGGQAAEVVNVEPTPQDSGRIARDFLRQLRAATPAGDAVAGPSSGALTLTAAPSSRVAQQALVVPQVPEPSPSSSSYRSGSGSGSGSDSDSGSGSGSSSDSSDNEGVGGMDGEELYRNIVSAPTSRNFTRSDSPVSPPSYDTLVSTPAHTRPRVPAPHVPSTVPPPLQMPAPRTALIGSSRKPSSTSIPPLPPASSILLSEMDIVPSRSDTKSKDKGKKRATRDLDNDSDVLIVGDDPDLVIVSADSTPLVNPGRRNLRARTGSEEAGVEKAEKAAKKAAKKTDKADKTVKTVKADKADKADKKSNKGTVDVTEDISDAEPAIVSKPKPKPKRRHN